MRMSRCFTWFPFDRFGEPNIYHDSGVFYKNVGIYDIVVIFDFEVFLVGCLFLEGVMDIWNYSMSLIDLIQSPT